MQGGHTLATGGATGKVTFWDVRRRAVVRTLQVGGRVSTIAVSPDGKLLAVQTRRHAGSSPRVEVRDLESGRLLYRRTGANGTAGLDFSPDGHRLAVLGCCNPGSTIEVWSARSGAKLFRPRLDGQASTIAFSPEGRVVAAGTADGKVALWRADDGSRLAAPIEVATGAIETVSFTPDGRSFVASSSDQTATLWDTRTHKRIASAFPGEDASVPVARFAPSGDLVLDNIGATAVWPMDLPSWVRFACRVAGRDLTEDEWNDLLPARQYRPVCP